MGFGSGGLVKGRGGWFRVGGDAGRRLQAMLRPRAPDTDFINSASGPTVFAKARQGGASKGYGRQADFYKSDAPPKGEASKGKGQAKGFNDTPSSRHRGGKPKPRPS